MGIDWEKFNERLDRDTYISAADKIEKYGDYESANKLRKHANEFPHELKQKEFKKKRMEKYGDKEFHFLFPNGISYDLHLLDSSLKFLGHDMNMSIDMFLDEALDTDPQLVPVSIVAFLEPSNSSENYQLFIYSDDSTEKIDRKLNVDLLDDEGESVEFSLKDRKEAVEFTNLLKESIISELEDMSDDHKGLKHSALENEDYGIVDVFENKVRKLVNDLNYRLFM